MEIAKDGLDADVCSSEVTKRGKFSGIVIRKKKLHVVLNEFKKNIGKAVNCIFSKFEIQNK